MKSFKATAQTEIIHAVQKTLAQESCRNTSLLITEFLKKADIEDNDAIAVKAYTYHIEKLLKLASIRQPHTPNIEIYNYEIAREKSPLKRCIILSVNDDMPFLIDSILALLKQKRLKVRSFLHPILNIRRNLHHKMQDIAQSAAEKSGYHLESMTYFELKGHLSDAQRATLKKELERVLKDVRLVVEDWTHMRQQNVQTIEELENTTSITEEKKSGIIDFLKWLDNNHFTYLGCQELKGTLQELSARGKLKPIRRLGLFQKPDLKNLGSLSITPEIIKKFNGHPLTSLNKEEILVFSLTKEHSKVHNAIPMDLLEIKQYNEKGEVIGLRQFLGLPSSVADSRGPRDIPLIKEKVNKVLELSGFKPQSYDGRVLLQILNNFPRSELFQASIAELLKSSMMVHELRDKTKVVLFVRPDRFGQYVSCLVYVAKDRYSNSLQETFGEILEQEFQGTISHAASKVSDYTYARIHYILHVSSFTDLKVNLDKIEQRLTQACRSWSDHLGSALIQQYGEDKAASLSAIYSKAFSSFYQEQFSIHEALQDIKKIEQTLKSKTITTHLYRKEGQSEEVIRLKIYNYGTIIPLSDIVSILESFGFTIAHDTCYPVTFKTFNQMVWIQDFESKPSLKNQINIEEIQDKFNEAIGKTWQGKTENDGFNKLTLRAKFNWHEIAIIRAYQKYLHQLSFTFSKEYIEEAFIEHTPVACLLIQLFALRFRPGKIKAAEKAQKEKDLIKAIEDKLDAIESQDQDRILRRFLNVILATVRTNAYQYVKAGKPKPYISFKFNGSLLEDAPLPKPAYEIFVYSPRMEAVHLRGGKVARGGLRWSDRREDFRTEILNLLKAQMIKNAVIVPVGSKGGFVVKYLPTNPEERRQEVIHSYQTMIRGMLDITDNVIKGKIIPPKDVICYDNFDPYLVVAADKGTATFSDIANAISKEYNFWLGDAFASGGSSGYDHKKMGITARGAWESVQRHFWEYGVDLANDTFTVIGVGDMGGDVFGNGMLLSDKIRLLGAFNHLHIFVDPDPDPVRSFKERSRLFRTPSVTWDEYSRDVLSKGGGIFNRSAKQIPLSPEIKAMLNLKEERITPNNLIRALLTAKVNLLWFGGIGTFVKASNESNADIGDRTNDAIRINGTELQAQVIAEGANLGMSQKARIEFARHGGSLNSDSIDNSGGVDCSDHEVNIKILLGEVVESGEMTLTERNRLLEDMTDIVAEHVLCHNYMQNQSLSLTQSEAASLIESHHNLIRMLEKEGILDRQQAHLPSEAEFEEMIESRIPLTRPELGFLLSYSKIWLYQILENSSLIDDPYFEEELSRYFPHPLRGKYLSYIMKHPLRREIIATCLSNDINNQFGSTFIAEIMNQTNAKALDVVRAVVTVRALFGTAYLFQLIHEHSHKTSAHLQLEIIKMVRNAVEKLTLWMLYNDMHSTKSMSFTIKHYLPSVKRLETTLEHCLEEQEREIYQQQIKNLIHMGVSLEMAKKLNALRYLEGAFDIIQSTEKLAANIEDAAIVYFFIGKKLGFHWLKKTIELYTANSYWENIEKTFIINDISNTQRYLAIKILSGDARNAYIKLDHWFRENAPIVQAIESTINDLLSTGDINLIRADVVNRRFKQLIG